ncbi:MAG: hypothetical protein WCV93_05420 [Candidatus Shapirobacteria bacterium]|jgi:S-adenosylmethionine:tRNA-ribosyltransferase-isomerase (queuine synthetase)
MHHLAILNPSRKLLPKIISGEKSIESRWYKFKISPWNKIKTGDTVYFKDSGKPVTAQAQVSRVLQFDHPSKTEIIEIIREYGLQIMASKINIDSFYQSVKDKNYVILIFLKNPESITPFAIDKSGFGSACAWICVEDIKLIKICQK